jgi:uncharacterized protein (TIGR03790 family)
MIKRKIYILLIILFPLTFCFSQEKSIVAVIYNTNYDFGYDIATYYAERRGIDEKYIIGISTVTDEVISKDYYYEMIRDPVKNEIIRRGIKDDLKYLVTTKGMPLKIDIVGDPCAVYNQDGGGAIESFLCILFETATDNCTSPKIVNRYYDSGNPFNSFAYDFITFCPEQLTGTISYLVSRLDAYTPEDIFKMIDRSVAADKSGKGFYIIDDHPGAVGYEPLAMRNARDNLSNFGLSEFVIYDSTTVHVLSDTLENKGIIAYCSRGQHAFNSSSNPVTLGWSEENGYLGGNRFNWLNGAIFTTYESFNGYSFYYRDDGCPSGQKLGHRDNQNLVADFIQDGGTAGIGNVYEPFLSGVSRVEAFFNHYARGHYFIDAAYMSLSFITAMNVVVGDPLCRISDRIHDETDPGDTLKIEKVSLYRNYPNPFKDITSVSFALVNEGNVRLAVYNSLGEEILTVINERRSSGIHTIEVSLNSFPSGVYFYRLNVEGRNFIGKMVHIK